MSQNVYEEIAGKKPDLVTRMTQNPEVSSTVMAYLNLLVGMSTKMGFPINGVSIDPLVACDRNVFKARVRFHHVAVTMPRLWGTTSSFVEYANAKAGYLAMALLRNPALERWFESLVETLDNWAKTRYIPFEEIAITDRIITASEHILTFKVGRKSDLAT